MPKTVHSTRYKRFLEALAQARKQAGLTQAQLAQRLRRPQSYIAKIEGGERRLDILEFVEVAEAVGADFPALLQTLRGSKRP